ncbi:MAG: hypothetical protein AB8B97_17410 [Granulosicoccus sp.]
MSDEHASIGTATIDSAAPGIHREQQAEPLAKSGYLRRYRLPLTLAVIAVCLYVGSILYILLGRGQIS